MLARLLAPILLALATAGAAQDCPADFCTWVEGSVCGDCDHDFSVTILDAYYAAQAASYGWTSFCCDVNGDGAVTVLDAYIIAAYVTGEPATLCCP